ncbi:MAG: protein sorting system archaetidylserine decarboxylase [Natronomonas sp.]
MIRPFDAARVLPFDVAPGTWRLVCLPLAVCLPALLFSPPVALVCLGVAAAVVWFHRDPERSPPPSGIVAPADGRISVLRTEETGAEPRVRVGVFMNLTDVHVNRAPVSGTVESIDHTPGGHYPAFSKASERNERLTLDCGDCEVTLIAGAVARRIHPHVSVGERIDRGDRIGHISFGSRADVLLPPAYDRDDVRVEPGQHVRAGETVIVAEQSG